MNPPEYAPMLMTLHDNHFMFMLNHHRSRSNRIVLTNGCFDLLHPGHVDFLNRARFLGDVLIVIVNGDESIKELKGKDRPVCNLDERLFMLGSLKCVDLMLVSNESDLSPFITAIKPNIWVKGNDRNLTTLNQNERKAAEKCGAKIMFLDRYREFSTTGLISKIRGMKGDL